MDSAASRSSSMDSFSSGDRLPKTRLLYLLQAVLKLLEFKLLGQFVLHGGGQRANSPDPACHRFYCHRQTFWPKNNQANHEYQNQFTETNVEHELHLLFIVAFCVVFASVILLFRQGFRREIGVFSGCLFLFLFVIFITHGFFKALDRRTQVRSQ